MEVDKPQDLYQHVADIASKEMFKRAGEDNEWALKFSQYWADGLSRKVVKRATMCDAYGITPHGIRKYARSEGHLDWVSSTYGKEFMAAAVSELASLTLYGLEGAMEMSNRGKDYVRYLSEMCSEANQPLEWEVSTGFKVVHKYDEYVPVMSRSILYNKKAMEVSFGLPSGNIDPKGAWNGVAPNYIHSHDAAHMRLTINGMVDAGISQFSMIHDSFGCPAPQVPFMRDIIKKEFYEIHQSCQLEQIKQDVERLLGQDIEPVPTLGTLDPACVSRADYLFG